MKVIGIIGTRKRNTSTAFKKIKEKFYEIYEEGDWICSGGCDKGGDRCAEQIAKTDGIPILIYYPNYKRFSKGATFVRNTEIAKSSSVVIACVMNPEEGLDKVLDRKKGGSEDTLRKFVNFKEDEGFIPEVHLV